MVGDMVLSARWWAQRPLVVRESLEHQVSLQPTAAFGFVAPLQPPTCTSWPAALHAATSAASLRPEGSAAMIRMDGLMALAATAMPLIMPPPLTGTMMASSSGTWRDSIQ